MADITMCKGEGCLVKDRCYRFTARVTPDWQSYFMESPIVTRGPDKFGNCPEYWDNMDRSAGIDANDPEGF